MKVGVAHVWRVDVMAKVVCVPKKKLMFLSHNGVESVSVIPW